MAEWREHQNNTNSSTQVLEIDQGQLWRNSVAPPGCHLSEGFAPSGCSIRVSHLVISREHQWELKNWTQGKKQAVSQVYAPVSGNNRSRVTYVLKEHRSHQHHPIFVQQRVQGACSDWLDTIYFSEHGLHRYFQPLFHRFQRLLSAFPCGASSQHRSHWSPQVITGL